MSADPPRNFLLTTQERIRALTIGVPAYAARKRHIEDLEEGFVSTLTTLHATLVAKGTLEQTAIHEALLARARAFDLRKLERLIDAHNRYYPIEANLAIDRATGGYLLGGKQWLPEAQWTAERFVARALASSSTIDPSPIPSPIPSS